MAGVHPLMSPSRGYNPKRGRGHWMWRAFMTISMHRPFGSGMNGLADITLRQKENAMRLTTYTDFCLRVLIYVAVRPSPLPTIPQIAESYDISKNHLMKVVHELGLAGYLLTTRGKGGGLQLARPAETIVLGELIRRTEPDMALMPCFEPVGAPCAIAPTCKLKKVVQEARAAFLAVLDDYTLADLSQNKAMLSRLLTSFALEDPKPARKAPRKKPPTAARKPRAKVTHSDS